MTTEAATNDSWFKSSYSGGAGGECVEVSLSPATVRVRDTKRMPGSGPSLALPPRAWAAFVAHAAKSPG